MSVLQPVSPVEDVVVRARSLTKIYGKGDAAVTALDQVDVDLGRGEFTAIMGPSGSGKSTLMHCLAGLDSVTSGEVELDDIKVSSLSERKLTKLRRDRIGFIFQAFNLIPTLTAKENITLPADIAKRKISKERFDRVVDAVGIRDRLTHRPAELSGGQQQRVACARALVTEPAVVFADEPTGNLDSVSSHQVLKFLREAVDEFGQTVVMVTHDPGAAAWADRVLFLVDGDVVAELRDPHRDSILDALRELGDPTPVSTADEGAAEEPTQAPPADDELDGWKPGQHRVVAKKTKTVLESRPQPAPSAFTERTAPADPPAHKAPPAASSTQKTHAETEHIFDEEGPRPGESLDQALRRMAPARGLDPEAARMVDEARKILRDLPGSVIPPDDIELTGPIPVVRKVNKEVWTEDARAADHHRRSHRSHKRNTEQADGRRTTERPDAGRTTDQPDGHGTPAQPDAQSQDSDEDSEGTA